jgi:hypothetical protein
MEGGGVLVSLDEGESWRFSAVATVGRAFNGPQATSLAFGPGSNPELWMGSRMSGVFRSDETGLHWRPTGWPSEALRVGGVRVVTDPTNGHVAYGVSPAGLRRTTDNGAHWLRILGLPSSIAGLSVSAHDGSVYAWAGRKIFRSSNHGATWRQLPPLPRRRQ